MENIRLDFLETIRDNWNGLGSKAPNSHSISKGRELLSFFRERCFLPDIIAPSAEEGVTFSVSRDNRIAAIECFNDGEIVAVIYDEQNEPEAWEVIDSNVDITRTIDKMQKFIEDGR